MSNGFDFFVMNFVVYVVDDDDLMCNVFGWLFCFVGFGVEFFGLVQEFFDFDKCDVLSCLIFDVWFKG